jgi:hypothetical protein
VQKAACLVDLWDVELVGLSADELVVWMAET